MKSTVGKRNAVGFMFALSALAVLIGCGGEEDERLAAAEKHAPGKKASPATLKLSLSGKTPQDNVSALLQTLETGLNEGAFDKLALVRLAASHNRLGRKTAFLRDRIQQIKSCLDRLAEMNVAVIAGRKRLAELEKRMEIVKKGNAVIRKWYRKPFLKAFKPKPYKGYYNGSAVLGFYDPNRIRHRFKTKEAYNEAVANRELVLANILNESDWAPVKQFIDAVQRLLESASSLLNDAGKAAEKAVPGFKYRPEPVLPDLYANKPVFDQNGMLKNGYATYMRSGKWYSEQQFTLLGTDLGASGYIMSDMSGDPEGELKLSSLGAGDRFTMTKHFLGSYRPTLAGHYGTFVPAGLRKKISRGKIDDARRGKFAEFDTSYFKHSEKGPSLGTDSLTIHYRWWVDITHPELLDALEDYYENVGKVVEQYQGKIFTFFTGGEPCYAVKDKMGAMDSGYAPHARKAFREFLKQEHKTIERLNQKWGTAHTSFAEIEPPGDSRLHPRVMIEKTGNHYDFQRFRRQNWAHLFQLACRAFKKHCKSVPVTVLAWGSFANGPLEWGVDVEGMFQEADIIGGHSNRRKQDAEYLYYYSLNRYLRKPMMGEEACEPWQTLTWGGTYFKGGWAFNYYRDNEYGVDLCHWAMLTLINPEGYRHALFKDKLIRIGASLLNTEIAPAPLGVLHLEASQFNSYPRNLAWDEMVLTTEMLLDRNFDCFILPDKHVASGREDLSGYKCLLANYAFYVAPEVEAAVLRRIEAGGVLLSTGAFGYYDPYGHEQGRILQRAFGEGALEVVEEPQHFKVKVDRRKLRKGVTIIAYDPQNGEPVLVSGSLGKGRVIICTKPYSKLSEPNKAAYRQELLDAVGQRTAWASKENGDGVLVTRENPKTGERYLLVYLREGGRKNTPFADTITVLGEYDYVEDITTPGGFPVPAEAFGGYTKFALRVAEGGVVLKLGKYQRPDYTPEEKRTAQMILEAGNTINDIARRNYVDVASQLKAVGQLKRWFQARKLPVSELHAKAAHLKQSAQKRETGHLDNLLKKLLEKPEVTPNQVAGARILLLEADFYNQKQELSNCFRAKDEALQLLSGKRRLLRPKVHLYSTRTPGPVVIDGKGSEWGKVPAYRFPNKSARIQSQWDDRFIYFLVSVKDNSLVTAKPEELWRGDAIEYFFNCTGRPGIRPYGPTDTQFIIGVSGDAVFRSPLRFNGIDKVRQSKVAVRRTGAGYVAEMALALSEINMVSAPGLPLRCLIRVLNQTPGKKGESWYFVKTRQTFPHAAIGDDWPGMMLVNDMASAKAREIAVMDYGASTLRIQQPEVTAKELGELRRGFHNYNHFSLVSGNIKVLKNASLVVGDEHWRLHTKKKGAWSLKLEPGARLLCRGEFVLDDLSLEPQGVSFAAEFPNAKIYVRQPIIIACLDRDGKPMPKDTEVKLTTTRANKTIHDIKRRENNWRLKTNDQGQVVWWVTAYTIAPDANGRPVKRKAGPWDINILDIGVFAGYDIKGVDVSKEKKREVRFYVNR